MMSKFESDKLMQEAFEAALVRAAAESFQLPIHIATVGRNGAFMFCRYYKPEGELPIRQEVLAEYEDASGYELPINSLIVDATGKQLRLTIGGDDSDRITFH